MSLEPGRDLAHYHVLDKLGEGGMGAVYRANDRKLGRDVAIKVLPPELSGDAERLARFQREAQVLASLNHPNIAAIYGLEHVDGLRFLVLELVEGPDLAARLAQGPVPLEESLDIARQIAEALEAAHERGIVHRDLKPANVKQTAEGKVKVLDFGLAKAFTGGPSGEVDASRSPTITSLATRQGVIMGTAAYMSPEQARGATVDRRADIWSFGCVLLELVTGGNPFYEATVSDTLASILRSEPDWKRLPERVPPALVRLLRRCLDKDPHRRLRDIGEARIAIEGILAGAPDHETPTPSVAASGVASRRWPWITAAAVVVTAVVTLLVVRALEPAPTSPPIRRFEVIHGPFVSDSAAPPVLSPDGTKVVFSRGDRLWVRRLDQLEPQRLEGTGGATKPAWTADSGSIVFVGDGELRSIPVGGGSPVTLAFGIGDITGGGGIDCSTDGRIAYANGMGGISEISAPGGEPRVILAPDGEKEADFHEPTFLPDGSVLFVAHRVPEGADTLTVLHAGKRKPVFQIANEQLSHPVYSPTGHIVYHRGGPKAGLWAVPFSLARLEATGAPFLITADGNFPSTSNDGTLLYVGGTTGGMRQLVWVERDGTIDDPVGPEQAGIASPALSPDGSRVAVMAHEGDAGNIWVYDIERGTRTRLTFGTASNDWDPVWTPDSEEVIFWDGTTRALSRKSADGVGEAVRVVKPDILDSGIPSVSRDGKWMVFWAKPSPQTQDIWMLDLEGDGTPVPLLSSSFMEDDPRLSPDGAYLAYVSGESGKREVFLTRFPGANGKWQVSVDGGNYPVWSPAGDALFFLDDTRVKQVDVTLDPTPRLGAPRTLFDAAEAGLNVLGNSRFDVSRDGRRFLMVREQNHQDVAPTIVINYDWIAAFRQAH